MKHNKWLIISKVDHELMRTPHRQLWFIASWSMIIGSDQNFNCKKIKIYRIFKIVRSSVKIRTHTRAHVLNQPTLPYLKVIIFFVKTIRTLNESESESESVILETISALWILKSLNFDGVEIVFAQEFIVLFWWNKYYIGNNVIVMMNNEKSNYCNRLSRAKM